MLGLLGPDGLPAPDSRLHRLSGVYHWLEFSRGRNGAALFIALFGFFHVLVRFR
jgi:hypothetical protein